MWRTGGSVVEFSPATREARVRFPASALKFFVFIFLFHVIISILELCICRTVGGKSNH